MDKDFTHALWYSALTLADLDSDAVLDRAITHGSGCFVYDRSGRQYLDARSALWNAALGYGNQRIIDAIKAQLDRLPVAQIIRHDQPTQVALEYAERLVSTLPPPLAHVRFCSTGEQAVEGAVF